jgi:hypothetical protein
MAVGARETREGRAGGAESEEAGEGEALCGAVSGGAGRGGAVAFTLVASAAPIQPGGAERLDMSLSDRERAGASGFSVPPHNYQPNLVI